MNLIAKEILVKGLVQGVGFRPFIYRLAHANNLLGTVENNNLGVRIVIQGKENDIINFIEVLPSSIPEASHINQLEVKTINPNKFSDFSIIKSKSLSQEVTEVSPDIAVCINCLEDMEKQSNRINYAFTNCTNCGPRFTIIKDLPYDRPKTTMAPFIMCNECQQEYSNILDRRFHAQPVACSNCGPHYKLIYKDKEFQKIEDILIITSKLIQENKILAIKGLGGFHLACNPFDNETVKKLRLKKNREGKPLALMFSNIKEVQKYLYVNEEEKRLLEDWRRPIVLLKTKEQISEQLSLGLDKLGIMLPYMPFHYLLFKKLKIPALVLTSGNLSDEPIIIDNDVAIKSLDIIADASIIYNREIHNRTDDSVAFVANNKSRIIRRSRSYAPSPIHTNFNTEGIFAAGAELVNCFGIGKGSQIILSQHIGDLKNMETFEFYKESIQRFSNLFRFKPDMVVSDLHPEYLSSKYSDSLNIKSIKVQHHHAHIASCMVENNLDEKVIGISLDGTGYGTDGNIWGGEILVCNLEDFERFNHFEYIKQPGGDAANHHPWRMLLSYLIHYFGSSFINENKNLFDDINNDEISLVSTMIEKDLNCPLTSSAGRLFDAVSALLGVCKNSTYHAEAPMRLEALARKSNTKSKYTFKIDQDISFKSCFEEMIVDLKNNREVSDIAKAFHNTIIDLTKEVSLLIRSKYSINKVALSGGSFQNKILLENCENTLKESGFEVFSQSDIPSNDGGIALGQIAIAAKLRELGRL